MKYSARGRLIRTCGSDVDATPPGIRSGDSARAEARRFLEARTAKVKNPEDGRTEEDG